MNLYIGIGIAVWFVLSFPLGFLIGKVIQLGDVD